MTKTTFKRENLYTAVVIYYVGGIAKGAKYRKIDADKPAVLRSAMAFFKAKYPTATHVNLYGGLSKQFARREYFA